MNFNSILFLFVILFSTSCKSEKEKIAQEITSREEIIDSTIQNFKKQLLKPQIDSVFSKYDFNGSVAVIEGDHILYRKDQGFENFKTETPLDSSSVFAIASISKQFTAVLILLQEEAGKLSTEDSVAKFLPEFRTKVLENIKIKELLNHTSGISDFGNGLLSKPGEDFHYSNKGFRLLGEIIDKVSGKSFDENAKELFLKVGMKNSATANLFQNNHLSGAYTGNAKNSQAVGNMPKRLANSEISVPAGGILSTVSDLHLWNKSLYGGLILKPQSLEKLLAKSSDRKHPVFGKMGYGFGIMMSKNAPLSYFHSGYVKGAPSLLVFYPESKTSLIILSNIAEESRGKNAIFNPHKDIKQAMDVIEKAVIGLKK
ncbi:serine hydrolase domain-containing protein [Chryseobacterium sp. MP_3.2]|uniref:serine hydrolase domain-containing protein n=1 Tax=Chryseobacterium sp. MP_3.2 TaxID=3071712 RepID=UPI002E09282E|nr:CubicO group peptidase (beta-lactamase class C family) [Chryseobacterium sp. MP_3.2]